MEAHTESSELIDHTDDAFDAEIAAYTHANKVLAVETFAYGELLTTTTRAERDKVLTYSLIGLAIGSTNALPTSIISLQLPIWALRIGIGLVTLYFTISYANLLLGDTRRLKGAIETASLDLNSQMESDFIKGSLGLAPEEVSPGFLEQQQLLNTQLTNEFRVLDLEEALFKYNDGESQQFDNYARRRSNLYKKYEALGWKGLEFHYPRMRAAADNVAFLALSHDYVTAVTSRSNAHLIRQVWLNSIPIAVGIGALLFVIVTG